MLLPLLQSFAAGLLTPLTAACVIPLYPAYLSYLAGQDEETRIIHTGLAVAVGVITFMLLLGVVFTTVLQRSLTSVIGVISPIAFVGLFVASLILLLDVDLSGIMPEADAPDLGGPLRNAFSFGFFFGAIVLPCNPGFIAYFLSRSLLVNSPVSSMANFLMFGTGIAAPLLAFSIISEQHSQQVIRFLTTYKTEINRIAGAVLLVVSLYYLVAVFDVVPL